MGLGNSLKHCDQLEELDLSNNQIGDEGVNGLSEGLQQCSHLGVLCLSNNLISDALLKTGCSANTFLGVGPTLAMPPPTGCYVTPPGVYYTHHLQCLETPPF